MTQTTAQLNTISENLYRGLADRGKLQLLGVQLANEKQRRDEEKALRDLQMEQARFNIQQQPIIAERQQQEFEAKQPVLQLQKAAAQQGLTEHERMLQPIGLVDVFGKIDTIGKAGVLIPNKIPQKVANDLGVAINQNNQFIDKQTGRVLNGYDLRANSGKLAASMMSHIDPIKLLNSNLLDLQEQRSRITEPAQASAIDQKISDLSTKLKNPDFLRTQYSNYANELQQAKGRLADMGGKGLTSIDEALKRLDAQIKNIDDFKAKQTKTKLEDKLVRVRIGSNQFQDMPYKQADEAFKRNAGVLKSAMSGLDISNLTGKSEDAKQTILSKITDLSRTGTTEEQRAAQQYLWLGEALNVFGSGGIGQQQTVQPKGNREPLDKMWID